MGLILIILFILFRRIIIKMQLDRIEVPPNSPLSFQRKLEYVKQAEQTKQISTLLFVIFLLCVGLLTVTYSLYRVEEQANKITERNNLMKDEIYKIKKEQKQFLVKLPIRAYPEKGLGLKDYGWDELFKEENREEQYKIENDLSTKVGPYFGLSTALVVLDIPSHTLNIAIVGDSGNDENRQQIKENVKAFVAEAEGIPNLTQITFQMNIANNKDQKKTYSCTYTREEAEGKFSVVHEEE